MFVIDKSRSIDGFVREEAAALMEESGYTIERAIYDAIDRLYIPLSDSDLFLVSGQLATAIELYKTNALKCLEVRRELYRQFDELVANNQTVTVFSSDFNMSKKGHNAKVRKGVVNVFRQAEAADKANCEDMAAKLLIELNIRNPIMFGREIIAVIHKASSSAPAAIASVEYERVRQYRSVLFNSVTRMIAKLARAQARTLVSPTLDLPDLIQTALMSGLEAVESYRPIDSGKTFTTFVYNWVNGMLYKYVAERGRAVFIPRTVSDRFSYIKAAVEYIGPEIQEAPGWLNRDSSHFSGGMNTVPHLLKQRYINEEELNAIAAKATELLPIGKKPFTSEEVFFLISKMQAEFTLNEEVTDEDGVVVEVGDLLISPADMETEYDLKHAHGRLMRLIKPFCDDREFEVMALRWTRHEEVSYSEVARLYHQNTGKPMNKAIVRNIEAKMFGLIATEAEKDPNLKEKFMQIWESLDKPLADN